MDQYKLQSLQLIEQNKQLSAQIETLTSNNLALADQINLREIEARQLQKNMDTLYVSQDKYNEALQEISRLTN